MKMGRVFGRLVCNTTYQGLEGVPMLWVQPTDPHGNDKGKPVVCCDATRCAGNGEKVLFEGGREAAMALDETFVPVDHTILAIIDGTRLAEGAK